MILNTLSVSSGRTWIQRQVLQTERLAQHIGQGPVMHMICANRNLWEFCLVINVLLTDHSSLLRVV